jgi:hypothetical protein
VSKLARAWTVRNMEDACIAITKHVMGIAKTEKIVFTRWQESLWKLVLRLKSNDLVFRIFDVPL